MKNIYVILLFIMFSGCIFSQEYMTSAVRVAAGVSSLKGLNRYKDLPVESQDSFSAGNRFSWDFGILFQTGLRNNAFFQTEANFGMVGASLNGLYRRSGNRKVKVNSLDISNMHLSIYLGKKIPLSNNLKFFASAGGYIGYALESSLLYDDEKESVITRYDADFKSWDAGIVVATGLNYGKFQLSFNPQFGLIDISPDSSGVYHRAYKFALIYHFFR